jgi:hypothetical protein
MDHRWEEILDQDARAWCFITCSRHASARFCVVVVVWRNTNAHEWFTGNQFWGNIAPVILETLTQ